jgi:hypothetical protein
MASKSEPGDYMRPTAAESIADNDQYCMAGRGLF